jgi:hypothetical protein
MCKTNDVFILRDSACVEELPAPRDGRWVARWLVLGDQGHDYTVAKDAAGCWGCSCPRWKFKREECKHIARVADWLRTETYWVSIMTKARGMVRWCPKTAHKSLDGARAEAIKLRTQRRRQVRIEVKHFDREPTAFTSR